mmetsp:Transcript_113457/g.197037  ORF Transcript_113457/g.197037 Transcript_113457/m.197037 type:complete len:246 (+) Transcript_113457:1037-1774(+)
MTITSTPACAHSRHRSRSSGWVLTAAPTSSWLFLSRDARGKLCSFFRSDLLISATSSKESLTIGSFPFLLALSVSCAASRLRPSLPTMSAALWVITVETFRPCSLGGSRSMSRDVTMPRSWPPSLPVSVTGNPQKPFFFRRSSTSATVPSGVRTTGSSMKPWRNLLTLRTISACSSAVLLLCRIPTPPSWAMAIAIWCSVTVSMGELTNGVFSVMFLVRRQSVPTRSAGKSMKPGSRRMSLYVRP